MDIDERIRRRQHRDESQRLIRDYESLSPVAHLDEPSGRGPDVERLLDHLDPVFDGRLPPNGYVHGPFGAGKSAIVTALFTHLRRLSMETQSAIYTSTRAESRSSPEFVYVDMRETTSDFAFYHRVLDELVEDSIPRHGIGTDEISDRLHDILGRTKVGAVVAVDHVDRIDGTDPDGLVDLFAGLPSNVSWLAVGRHSPDAVPLSEYTARTISIENCQRETLVDVLMERASEGLARQAIDYGLARRIAVWADGNVHDALVVLLVAAERAKRARQDRLLPADIDAACEEVPSPSVSLGRVLTLSANKRLVLRELVDLDPEDRESVTVTTEAISSEPNVELSAGTVKRYLYEMAEVGVVERVRTEESEGEGRPPSRIELRFPPTAFRTLYDLRQQP